MNSPLLKILAALSLLLVMAAPPAYAKTSAKRISHGESIAVIVNEDAITTSDLNDRMNLIITSSGLRNDPEIRSKLTPQILGALIEEQLKLQEAHRLNIEVEQKDIDAAFATLAAQNKFTADQFRGLLAKSGINLTTMERQIRSHIAWSKVIQQTIRPQVEVSDTDIDDYLARLASNKGKTEYLIAEILLPVGPQAKDKDVEQLGQKLIQEINKGAPFMKLAQQFSAAPGAAQGGDRGWISEGQLPIELENAMQTLEKNNLSQPIRLADGYHILLLRDKRMITDETLPTRDDVMNTIGVQRLDRLQARRMLDLKSAAFIETRGKS